MVKNGSVTQLLLSLVLIFSFSVAGSCQQDSASLDQNKNNYCEAGNAPYLSALGQTSEYFSLAPKLPAPEEECVSAINAVPIESSKATFKEVQYAGKKVIHRRLIFEEFRLERDGVSKPEVQQIFTSGARFFARGVALPVVYPLKRFRACESCGNWWYR